MNLMKQSDVGEFTNFVDMMKNNFSSDEERAQYVLSHQTSNQMMTYFYFLAFLNRESSTAVEVDRDDISNDEFLRAFDLYQQYKLTEERFSFKVIDVLENLLKTDNCRWVSYIFDKPFEEKISYSENKLMLLKSGLPMQDEFMYCDEQDLSEFFYIQKFQLYFRSDPSQIVDVLQNNQMMNDSYLYYINNRDIISNDFVYGFFGMDQNNMHRLVDSLPELVNLYKRDRSQQSTDSAYSEEAMFDDVEENAEESKMNSCINHVFSGKNKLTDEQQQKVKDLLKELPKSYRSLSMAYISAYGSKRNYESYCEFLETQIRAKNMTQRHQR